MAQYKFSCKFCFFKLLGQSLLRSGRDSLTIGATHKFNHVILGKMYFNIDPFLNIVGRSKKGHYAETGIGNKAFEIII